MVSTRRCTRSGCPAVAVATLTYDYGESVAVLGPLATYAEPHTYDLCRVHSERLSVPQGWTVMRLAVEDMVEPEPSHDDLVALAEAVREVGRRPVEPGPPSLHLVDPEPW